ncbi:MAG: disulfide bond formation protein DsbA [Actinomycetota bacterium]
MQWQPISLLMKNNPPEGSDYYAVSAFTNGLLRIMESVRASVAADGGDANHQVFRLYWAFGARIHHDKEYSFDPAETLRALGIDESHAAAADDESWDTVIREGMDAGLALVGNDVGTPIIATPNEDGGQAAYFGPVITKVPRGEKAVAMWDALMVMMEADGFFELKKTRQEMPDPGAKPDLVD